MFFLLISLFIKSTSFSVINFPKELFCFIVFFLSGKSGLAPYVFFLSHLPFEAYSLWSFASLQKARIKINNSCSMLVVGVIPDIRLRQVDENLDSLLNEVLLKVQRTFVPHVGSTSGLICFFWQI